LGRGGIAGQVNRKIRILTHGTNEGLRLQDIALSMKNVY
jgi:hypothetical protein